MALKRLTVICTLLATASALNNVALHKPVTSSGDGDYNSSRATDGNIMANSFAYCIETAYKIPSWWRVDLESVRQIERITIYFRTDWKYGRNGIQVYATDSTQVPSGDNCYNVTGTITSPITSTIPDVLKITCSARGRYVLLYTVVENEVGPLPLLDFCEVQVYATAGCPSGMFGPTCNQACHCQVETCHSTTGVCPSGVCQPGWQTESCDTECVDGKQYGSDCKGNCSSRKCAGNSRICPRDTGLCQNGCVPGWQGVDCTYAKDSSPHETFYSMSPVVAGFIGSIVTVVAILLLYGVWRIITRSRQKHDRKESVKETASPPTPLTDVSSQRTEEAPYDSLDVSSADKDNPYTTIQTS